MLPKKEPLSKSFFWLNLTQFLGALNDNIFQLLIIIFIINLQGDKFAGKITALAGGVFVIPFLLFSAYAGILADRRSKRNLIVYTKILEVIIMAAGLLGFWMQSPIFLYSVLFLMATQSTLFSPAKYGIIPEIVKTEQLTRANSYLEACTYLAIILGTAGAWALPLLTGANYVTAALFCITIAVIGLASSSFIHWTLPLDKEKKAAWFFLRDLIKTLKETYNNKYLFMAIMASAYFLLIGAFIKLNLIPYGIQKLHLTQNESAGIFVVAALGIGFGALVAGKLSGRNIEVGLIPLGSLGITVTSLLLALTSEHLLLSLIIIFLLGVSSGLFIVPLQTLIQALAPKKSIGQIIATTNFISWIGVLIASLLLYLFSEILNFSPATGFLFVSLLTFILTIITFRVLPDFLLRFVALVITRLFYRIRVKNIETIPTEGPALLVCNYGAWVDAFLLIATQQRRIRFIVDRQIYNKLWLKPILKLSRCIPISSTDRPRQIIEFFKETRAAIRQGDLVCIFVESTISQKGLNISFNNLFEHLVQDISSPVIPIYIGRTWGSIFSYCHSQLGLSCPLISPYSVAIYFGKQLSTKIKAAEIRMAIMELSNEYFADLKPKRRSLAYLFVKTARKHWFQKAITDDLGKKLTYCKVLVGTILLAQELRKKTRKEKYVGILLPSSVGCVLSNLALTFLRKVAVNLNFTAPRKDILSAIEQCQIKHIISSRTFIEKMESSFVPPGTIYLEDILKNITSAAKRKAFIKARFMPARILTREVFFKADNLATVIFSSGSTGEPKGVMLSHHNIISNIEAFRTVFNFNPNDNICAVLPLFHSFGYTCTLWLPLLSGFSASYVSNPLDGKKVAQTAKENKSTFLFATPTFLLIYLRRAKKEDFQSLRIVVTGAEKLKPSIAEAFERKFKIKPLEGYGATELSPVVSFNLPAAKKETSPQRIFAKEGSIGHPLPGIAVKIKDVDSDKIMPIGKQGLLLVKGPNVMLGYLNKPDLTAEVLQDGWYNTGDIALMDDDGFVVITDRLARFSKIGGEMVPHIAIEEVLLNALGTSEQVVAVTSVPDESKGEQLVVLYLKKASDADKLFKIISQSDLPNIYKPSRDNYFEIETMPILGSGKLDIRKLKQLAMEAKGLAA